MIIKYILYSRVGQGTSSLRKAKQAEFPPLVQTIVFSHTISHSASLITSHSGPVSASFSAPRHSHWNGHWQSGIQKLLTCNPFPGPAYILLSVIILPCMYCVLRWGLQDLDDGDRWEEHFFWIIIDSILAGPRLCSFKWNILHAYISIFSFKGFMVIWYIVLRDALHDIDHVVPIMKRMTEVFSLGLGKSYSLDTLLDFTNNSDSPNISLQVFKCQQPFLLAYFQYMYFL